MDVHCLRYLYKVYIILSLLHWALLTLVVKNGIYFIYLLTDYSSNCEPKLSLVSKAILVSYLCEKSGKYINRHCKIRCLITHAIWRKMSGRASHGLVNTACLTHWHVLDIFTLRTRTSKTTWKWRAVPMYGYATPFLRHFHVVFDVRVLDINLSIEWIEWTC
jgi:hypothetical protein